MIPWILRLLAVIFLLLEVSRVYKAETGHSILGLIRPPQTSKSRAHRALWKPEESLQPRSPWARLARTPQPAVPEKPQKPLQPRSVRSKLAAPGIAKDAIFRKLADEYESDDDHQSEAGSLDTPLVSDADEDHTGESVGDPDPPAETDDQGEPEGTDDGTGAVPAAALRQRLPASPGQEERGEPDDGASDSDRTEILDDGRFRAEDEEETGEQDHTPDNSHAAEAEEDGHEDQHGILPEPEIDGGERIEEGEDDQKGEGGEKKEDGEHGDKEGHDEVHKEGQQDDDDPPPDEPWVMSRSEKIALQVGWLVQVLLTILVGLVAYHCWPYRRRVRDSFIAHPPPTNTSAWRLYEALWGLSPVSTFINASIVIVAFTNLIMFALESESDFDKTAKTPFAAHIPLKDWAPEADYWVQVFSVGFFVMLLGLRVAAAPAHPNFRHYGASAGVRWLLGSIYAHIDIIAITPSIIDIILGEDRFMNLIWMTIFRTFDWMERQKSTGMAIRHLRSLHKHEGPLIATMMVGAGVLWVLLSGLYFLANCNNEKAEWDAAEYFIQDVDPPQKWQRFESIPSSMFFVLLNLCKENPGASWHREFVSRILVMTVCIFGTAIFAMPAGVVGAALQRSVEREIEENEAPEVDNQPLQLQAEMIDMRGREGAPIRAVSEGAPRPVYNDPGTGSEDPFRNREDRAPSLGGQASKTPAIALDSSFPLQVVTFLLCFGSVQTYFWYTAWQSASPYETFLWMEVDLPESIYVKVDLAVAIIFLLEWLVRIVVTGPGYLCTGYGLIDLLAWLPGVIHFSQYMLVAGEHVHALQGFMFFQAMCTFRLFKLERYLHAFQVLGSIMYQHGAILKATSYLTMLIWLVASTLLYYTEGNSADGDMKENYGSLQRALWAEAINLHGEWVWCDYSMTGKAICVFIVLIANGIFMVPIAVFSEGFQNELDNCEDSFDIQAWQTHERPERTTGAKRVVYDLLFAHLHQEANRRVAEEHAEMMEDQASDKESARVSGTVRKSRIEAMRTRGSSSGASGGAQQGRAQARDQSALEVPKSWGVVKNQTVAARGRASSAPDRPNRSPSGWSAGGKPVGQAMEGLSVEYRFFRGISVLMTCAVTISTTCLTMERFNEENCTDQACEHTVWCFHLFDVLAAMFFTMEFILRTFALGWKHPVSLVGLFDIVSLVMLYATLVPSFREKAFHPTYGATNFVGLWDDMAVPLRLLRLFCLESYVHSIHIITRVAWINRKPLAKSCYNLVTIWFVFGTVCYLLENNPAEAAEGRAAQAACAAKVPAEDECPELNMAQRYEDIMTGLQYSLVHLTGDYPITEYSGAAQVAHLFGMVFGMVATAAFTGIFVSGFLTYLKSGRVVERKLEAEQRWTSLMRFMLILTRTQRRWKRYFEAKRIAAAAGVQVSFSPANFRTVEEVKWEEEVKKKAQLQTALQSVLRRETSTGVRLMAIANAALLINIAATLVSTIPEADSNWAVAAILDSIELTTGYVFILEYTVHLYAASKKWHTLTDLWRVIDLVCLLPTFFSLWFAVLPFSWRNCHVSVEQFIAIARIFRVVRILDFPFVRKTRQFAWTALTGACSNLLAPVVLALSVWVTSSSLFMWLENMYDGPDKGNMESLPGTLYWTAIYIIGEWANVDFSPGAGSRMCIFYCLFGVAVFAIPVGLMMEAVESAIQMQDDKKKAWKVLLTKSSGSLGNNTPKSSVRQSVIPE